MTRLALFDLDGVLADDDHRIQFALDKKWPEYFNLDRVASDGVHPKGETMVATMQNLGWAIGYLTARRWDLRDVTEAWLDTHGFPPGRLIMRSALQKMRAGEYKALEMGALIGRNVFEGLVLFDDDPEVIRTVAEVHGEQHVSHCTWSVKPDSLVKYATI